MPAKRRPGYDTAPPGGRSGGHDATNLPRVPAENPPEGPRARGPSDLRLVPPALAVWGTAALLTGMPPTPAIAVTTVSLLAALVLLYLDRLSRPERGPRPAARPGGTGAPRRRARSGLPRCLARVGSAPAAVLLGVAASAASAGLHGADPHRGPVPEQARGHATITADVEVTGDPKEIRPRHGGPRPATPAVSIRADVRRVVRADGSTLATRTPVLLIVFPGRFDTAGEAVAGPSSDPAARPSAATAWLGLLPTTRLRVTAQAAPPARPRDRIAAVLRIRDTAAPEVTAGPSAAQRLAGRLREGLREATDGLPADPRALLPGLVVGDTTRITADLEEAFAATDLAHTLAVSGSNLTITLALLLGAPGTAGRTERRGAAPLLGLSLRATAVAGGVLCIGFVVVCRPEPSVLRAAACGGVALLALATGRRRTLLPALAAAVLLLVLYDPWLARSYGFLLSVLATGALLTLAPRWSASLRRRGVPPRLAEASAAAMAAQAVCAPVVVVLSARVSLVAVPCNLLAEVALAPATVLGFGALGIAPLAMPVAEALAWCAGWPAGWLAAVARCGAALPGASVAWPATWGGAALLALAVTAVALTGRHLSRRPWWCGALALALTLAVVRPDPLPRLVGGWPPPGWRLVMCDVGQGDALVLSAGPHTGVVVDAGPDPASVDRCLRSLGVTRVPLVVLTHFHADHVGGLSGVLRGRRVGAIETTGLEEPAGQAAAVRALASRSRIPLRHAAAGEARRSGSLTWQVVWPPATPAAVPGTDGPNDASVTLLVRTAGLRLLLLGDLEPPAQRALDRSYGTALADVDVVKVAHHGSAGQDEDFLRRVRPRLALVSCGADNSYGHPAPRTLAALRAGGATVLRTDRDGAVAVTGTAADLRVAVHRRPARSRARGTRARRRLPGRPRDSTRPGGGTDSADSTGRSGRVPPCRPPPVGTARPAGEWRA
ncbi:MULTISPECIES: ComEC/Rec2 family competence protein [unclassified Streptomyces]|uniref:ComEC/Rec2 family competence protein n=1 Tax=unclassified Streptomyces TaxID=2593676 RepID=UPI001903852D|nr:ComEC/Rec2 family competence protein [Streptomyces sp. HSG2]